MFSDWDLRFTRHLNLRFVSDKDDFESVDLVAFLWQIPCFVIGAEILFVIPASPSPKPKTSFKTNKHHLPPNKKYILKKYHRI